MMEWFKGATSVLYCLTYFCHSWFCVYKYFDLFYFISRFSTLVLFNVRLVIDSHIKLIIFFQDFEDVFKQTALPKSAKLFGLQLLDSTRLTTGIPGIIFFTFRCPILSKLRSNLKKKKNSWWIVEIERKSKCITHIHDRSLSWCGTSTSITSGGVKLDLYPVTMQVFSTC